MLNLTFVVLKILYFIVPVSCRLATIGTDAPTITDPKVSARDMSINSSFNYITRPHVDSITMDGKMQIAQTGTPY